MLLDFEINMRNFIKTSLIAVACTGILGACDLIDTGIDQGDQEIKTQEQSAESFQLDDILSPDNLGQIVGSGGSEPEQKGEVGTSTVLKKMSVQDAQVLSSNGYMDGTDLGRSNASNTVGLQNVEVLIWNTA